MRTVDRVAALETAVLALATHTFAGHDVSDEPRDHGRWTTGPESGPNSTAADAPAKIDAGIAALATQTLRKVLVPVDVDNKHYVVALTNPHTSSATNVDDAELIQRMQHARDLPGPVGDVGKIVRNGTEVDAYIRAGTAKSTASRDLPGRSSPIETDPSWNLKQPSVMRDYDTPQGVMMVRDDYAARIEALEAAVLALATVELGDRPGHIFHGNQYGDDRAAETDRHYIDPFAEEDKLVAEHGVEVRPHPTDTATLQVLHHGDLIGTVTQSGDDIRSYPKSTSPVSHTTVEDAIGHVVQHQMQAQAARTSKGYLDPMAEEDRRVAAHRAQA